MLPKTGEVPRAVFRRIVRREALELRAVGLVQATERRARHRRTRGHWEQPKRLDDVVVPRLDVLDCRLRPGPERHGPEQLVGPDRDATLGVERLRLRGRRRLASRFSRRRREDKK